MAEEGEEKRRIMVHREGMVSCYKGDICRLATYLDSVTTGSFFPKRKTIACVRHCECRARLPYTVVMVAVDGVKIAVEIAAPQLEGAR